VVWIKAIWDIGTDVDKGWDSGMDKGWDCAGLDRWDSGLYIWNGIVEC
jgi:hypothetical protein